MLAGDLHRLSGVAEQGGEPYGPFVSGASPEIAVFQRTVMGGQKNDRVVLAPAAEAVRFPRADEIRDRLHPADLFHAGRAVLILRDIILKSAADREDRRRFLHDLNGMLRDAGELQ